MAVSINLVAVLVTSIIAMVIGFLWYSPVLFGNAWMKLSKLTPKDMEKAKKKGMGKTYFLSFLGILLMNYVLAHFVDYTQATSFFEGILTGFWVWAGFVAPVLLGSIFWEGKPVKLYLINSLHYLVMLAVSAGILAVWI